MKKFLVLLFVVVLLSCNLPSRVLQATEVVGTPVVLPETTPTIAVPATATPTPTTTATSTLSVPTPIVTPTPAAIPAGSYVVQTGDTLSGIALRSGVSIEVLVFVNHIANPDEIYAGQTLIIPDVGFVIPTPEPVPSDGKQIVVVLSEQALYAYEDGNLLNKFIVSTGIPGYPTVTGDFRIYIKLEKTRMTGPGYDLPNVPWTMYFYKGYGLHGTYWHHNFGHPMSHGCVNMRTQDAKWLFDWASIGTPVHIE